MIASEVHRSRLVGRVIIALALSVGFYLLAAGVIAALLLIPYEIWRTTGHISARLGFFGVGTAVLIVYAIAPRLDRFVPPGPVLSELEHPELFRLIRRVAQATGQSMPEEVYLLPDMNAWVANRGGILGIGSRRLMGLGLPTFHALTTPQFAAVLAHEFGHYHHGDVALGPWLYRLRQSIGRTLSTLGERNNLLVIPFNWYGTLFVRVTSAVSRSQEYGADALAARVVGKDALARGLEDIHAMGPLYDGYWGSEVIPVLAAGRRPPIADGFRRFVKRPHIQEAKQLVLEDAMAAADDLFDTHPPLKQRLAALTAAPEVAPAIDLPASDSAAMLLGDREAAERMLLNHLSGPDGSEALKPITWDRVGSDVWIPIWQDRLNRNSARLTSIRCADVGAMAADPAYLAVRMGFAARSDVATEQHRHEAELIFGAALALLLLGRGGVLEVDVGEHPFVTLDGTAIKPFLLPRSITSGEITASDWYDQCQKAGLQDVILAHALEANMAEAIPAGAGA